MVASSGKGFSYDSNYARFFSHEKAWRLPTRSCSPGPRWPVRPSMFKGNARTQGYAVPVGCPILTVATPPTLSRNSLTCSRLMRWNRSWTYVRFPNPGAIRSSTARISQKHFADVTSAPSAKRARGTPHDQKLAQGAHIQSFARVEGEKVTYPGEAGSLFE